MFVTKEQLKIEDDASLENQLELSVEEYCALSHIKNIVCSIRNTHMPSSVLTYPTQLLSMPGNSAQDLYADLVAEVCRTEGSLSLNTKTRKNDRRECVFTFQLLTAICSAQNSFH